MKKAILIVALVVFAISLMGCPSITLPASVGTGKIGNKTGQSQGTIILGLFGHANGSVIEAAKKGGITEIGAVDITTKLMVGGVLVTVITTVAGN